MKTNRENESIRVAIYCRSSKDEHNVSCESQEHELRELAGGRGEMVIKVYKDPQRSSTKDDLPEFAEMLLDAKAGIFDKIYSLNTSRFGRDQFQAQYAKRLLRRDYEVEVVFAELPRSGNFYDDFIEKIFEAIDELHKMMCADGARRGQRQNIRKGFRAGGRAPFGYRLVYSIHGTNKDGQDVKKSKFEPDPANAPILREIFEKRARGESRRSICRDLEARGILPPDHKRTRSKHWNDTTILGFEANWEEYAGHLVYDRHPAKGRKSDLLINRDKHEPIITEKLGKLVFGRNKSTQNRYIRGRSKGSRGYSLAGLIFCADDGCHAPYHGDCGYYKPDRKKANCGNSGISQQRIESYLTDVLENHVLPQFDPKKAYHHWRKKTVQCVGKKTDRAIIVKEMNNIEGQKQRIITAVSKGLLEGEDVKTQVEELKTRKGLLEIALENAKVREEDFNSISHGVKKLFKEFKETFSTADVGTKQRFFRTFFDRIEIGPKIRDKNGERIERRKLILHTLLPLPNMGSLASPRGIEPLLPG